MNDPRCLATQGGWFQRRLTNARAFAVLGRVVFRRRSVTATFSRMVKAKNP